MNKFHTYSIVTALSLFGAALAQGQQQQTMPPEWPQPSTNDTEGPAADRTPSDQMPAQDAPGQMEHQMEHPRPATSPSDDTAANRSPSDKSATMKEDEMVGAKVVSQTDAPLGKVVDVVFDARNQPAYVVITSEGQSTAVPYSVAHSMMSEDKIVMDKAKLHSAPKMKKGEWQQSTGTWQSDSTRYWEHRGG